MYFQEIFATTRCVRKIDVTNDDWCSDEIIDPESTIDVVKNDSFSSTDKIVQLKPQEINVDIRTGDTVRFELFYKRAAKYPVDLYFLFDASLSMQTNKEKLVNQSDEIYKILREMTDNVYLGIGSFIDKNALPIA